MTSRAKQPLRSGGNVQFPPEADGAFGVVSEEVIADLNERLNERFDLGRGRLTVIEDVPSAS